MDILQEHLIRARASGGVFARSAAVPPWGLRLTGSIQLAVHAVVIHEVGCGLVPESNLGRDFRDHAGFLNQRAASVADEVYFMVFGCPLRVK